MTAALDPLLDHNTRVVLLGVVVLGASAGAAGSLLQLRGRSLLADPLGHATLPGIALAFMWQVARGGDGRDLPTLLLGALLAALAAAGAMLLLGRVRRLDDDGRLALILTLFYGGGVALMAMAQQLEAGRLAGVQMFLTGKAAQLVTADVTLIAALSAVSIVLLVAFWKEFVVLCFDATFARASGLPVARLDFALLLATVLVIVAGLRAVGLILIMALLIIPPAAARFWTQRPSTLTALAAGFGALAASLGTYASTLAPRLSTGPLIVLASAAVFGVSLLAGTRRGIAVAAWRRRRARGALR